MSDIWPAAAGWWGHATVAGGGVLLFGWVGGRLARGPAGRALLTGWAVRGAVLAAVLCLFPAWLTLPVPQWSTPSAPVTELDPVPVPLPEFEFATVGPVDVIEAPERAPLRVAANPAEKPAEPWNPVPLLLCVYGATAAALLLHMLVGHVALWRLRRTSGPAPARVLRVADSLTDRPPVVRVSDRVDSPVCFGVVWPTVLLPRPLATRATADELRWVLAHEFDHLDRGDPRTAVWAGVCRAVFFFVPWFWVVRRDLGLAQEFLADAAAAAAGGRAADYAAFLVDLSGPGPRRREAVVRTRSGPGVPTSSGG